jgi:hypothetical protein
MKMKGKSALTAFVQQLHCFDQASSAQRRVAFSQCNISFVCSYLRTGVPTSTQDFSFCSYSAAGVRLFVAIFQMCDILTNRLHSPQFPSSCCLSSLTEQATRAINAVYTIIDLPRTAECVLISQKFHSVHPYTG